MSEDTGADFDMKSPDEQVAVKYAAAQSKIIDACEETKSLLSLVSKHRGLKALSAVTALKHKLEKLVLDTLKHADKVMNTEE